MEQSPRCHRPTPGTCVRGSTHAPSPHEEAEKPPSHPDSEANWDASRPCGDACRERGAHPKAWKVGAGARKIAHDRVPTQPSLA
jgi:hypothetical protein